MKLYIKQNKILFLLTILTSVIASLGYVFMAVLFATIIRYSRRKKHATIYGNDFIFDCLFCNARDFSLSSILA